jgi:hypothetical protein
MVWLRSTALVGLTVILVGCGTTSGDRFVRQRICKGDAQCVARWIPPKKELTPNDIVNASAYGVGFTAVCFAAVRSPICMSLLGAGVVAGVVAKNRREELVARQEISLDQIQQNIAATEEVRRMLRTEREALEEIERFLKDLDRRRDEAQLQKERLREMASMLRTRVQDNDSTMRDLSNELSRVTSEVQTLERQSGGRVQEIERRVATLKEQQRQLRATLGEVAASTANVTSVLRRYSILLEN